MLSETVRFPFIPLPGTFFKRPWFWVTLKNLHNTRVKESRYRALVDTGADYTLAPKALCRRLRHVFDAGTSPSTTGGGSAGKIMTFCHVMRLTIVPTIERDGIPGVGNKECRSRNLLE